MAVSYSSGVSLGSGGTTAVATATTLGLVKGAGIALDGTLAIVFVETIAAPNATVPVEYYAPATAYANADIAIVPKGTGGFALAVADGTAVGGNKRGTNAVDLQLIRSSASQVASGDNSFATGVNNTVSAYIGTAIGQANNVNNRLATAIGYGSVNFGQEAIALGANHTASGNSSFAIGRFANTNGIYSQIAFGHGSDALGRYQATLTGLRQSTVGAVATRATADAASAAANNQLALRNNSAVKFTGQVVAFDTTTLDSKEWAITGLIKCGASAAATSLVGAPTAVSTFADTGATMWALALAADTTNGCLSVTVTGAGANTVRWMVQIQAYEVTA